MRPHGCQGKGSPCQRKVRSSGFVQNEKFRFSPAGSQDHDNLSASARGRARAEMQSRGDGVGSASNRHKPSFNGRNPCGGLSCPGCLLPSGRTPLPKPGVAFKNTHCFGEILERRLCNQKREDAGPFFARLSLWTTATFLLALGIDIHDLRFCCTLVQPEAIHPAPSASGRRCRRRLGSNDRWCGNRLGLLTGAHS